MNNVSQPDAVRFWGQRAPDAVRFWCPLPPKWVPLHQTVCTQKPNATRQCTALQLSTLQPAIQSLTLNLCQTVQGPVHYNFQGAVHYSCTTSSWVLHSLDDHVHQLGEEALLASQHLTTVAHSTAQHAAQHIVTALVTRLGTICTCRTAAW